MRLTILNQFYRPDISPTAHLAASLAEHRAGLGDEVSVITSRGGYVAKSGEQAREDQRRNPRVYRVWTPQLGKKTILRRCLDYASFYVMALWRTLRLPRQDVIISLTTPPFIAWSAILHKMLHPRTRVVLWSMDCYPEAAERSGKLNPNGFASRLMRRMNRAMFRRLDHVISLDTAMQELLASQYTPRQGGPGFSVIPNWEDAAFFPNDQSPPAWPQIEALGLKDKFIILYTGNMGFGHSFDTVLDAAEILRDEPAAFLFVGGGTRLESVREAVAQRRLQNVILHGYVPKEQTPMVLASAHASLITLRDEVLGVMSPSKLHSCLAMGLPILYVGPEKSNVDDAIRQFGCGKRVAHGDVAGLVQFIRELMRNPDCRQDMRHRARQAFDQAYCDQCTLPQFDQIINQLLQRCEPVNSAVASGVSQAT